MKGLAHIYHQLVLFAKMACVLMIALFLPQLYRWKITAVNQTHASGKLLNFKLGIENLPAALCGPLTKGKSPKKQRVGIITNPTALDQQGHHSVNLLLQKGVQLDKVFLAHGAPEKLDFTQHGQHKAPAVINLSNKQQLSFAHLFDDIDMVFFDMQDSGMRNFGLVGVLLHAMEQAALVHKQFVVLDRPNLLGWCMEGFSPFIAAKKSNAAQIPLRYGMTIGELATYLNKFVLAKPVNLVVVPMQNYNRHTSPRAPFACKLSPNLTTLEACYGYSFLGILGEVGPFDTGIGTDKAFQCLLLPESLRFAKPKWHELANLLQNYGIESKPYRMYSQRKKCFCSGLRFHIEDINRFSSFNTLLAILKFFKESGLKLTFSAAFDQALASDRVRNLLDGKISQHDLATQLNTDLQSFFKKAQSCFLYKPFPKMMQV